MEKGYRSVTPGSLVKNQQAVNCAKGNLGEALDKLGEAPKGTKKKTILFALSAPIFVPIMVPSR